MGVGLMNVCLMGGVHLISVVFIPLTDKIDVFSPRGHRLLQGLAASDCKRPIARDRRNSKTAKSLNGDLWLGLSINT